MRLISTTSFETKLNVTTRQTWGFLDISRTHHVGWHFHFWGRRVGNLVMSAPDRDHCEGARVCGIHCYCRLLRRLQRGLRYSVPLPALHTMCSVLCTERRLEA